MKKSRGNQIDDATLDQVDAMLFALSELIKHQSREPHVSEEWFNLGVSELIQLIAAKLQRHGSDSCVCAKDKTPNLDN